MRKTKIPGAIEKDRADTRVRLYLAILITWLFWWGNPALYSQDGGCKYLRNYTPKEYGYSPQNWCILQDKRGFIYVANQSSLLEFDGNSWQAITIPNLTVRSLALDETGTLYLGGNNEIGFLAANPPGTLQYVSLVEHLHEYEREFKNVWKTHAAKAGIFFRTSDYLFHWKPQLRQMRVLKPKGRFNASFTCSGEYFINDSAVGLMYMKEDRLELIPDGDSLADKRIYMIAPFNENSRELLVGTRSDGFYLYDGAHITPFYTGADDYIKEKQAYHGIRLSCGDFATATLLGGLVIFDARGNVRHIYDETSGLQDDDIKYVFEDSRENLWLALNEGVSKIEYSSPLSIYDKYANLPGLVLTVTRHELHKLLYVGTTSGLFFLSTARTFAPVPGIPPNCYALLPVENALFAATTEGVFQWENNTLRKIIPNSSYFLLRSGKNPHRVWVGTREGLISFYRHSPNNPRGKNTRWEMESKFKEITQPILSIVEEQNRNLWLGTLTSGVFYVEFPGTETTTPPVVHHYYSEHGLPQGEVYTTAAAGHVMFATGKGLFRFDEKNKIFVPDCTLGEDFTNGTRNVFRLVEDNRKEIWFHSRLRNYRAIPKPDGSYDININSIPFLRIPFAQVNAIYPETDRVWLASNDGLICFDKTIRKNYSRDFPVYIRKAATIDEKLILFAGYRKENHQGAKIPEIEYKNRNLRFAFASPFFESEADTEYRHFLEGYDREWSNWTRDTRADYTNLDSGTYRLRVQAKNVYEQISREDFFGFRVLPPWYKTWWAIVIYGAVFFGVIFFLVKWRSRQLEREKQTLERVISERTAEISSQKEQLEQQTLQLTVQSEKLKEMDTIKSRFFANISHEFRAPLTLIMGPLEQMIADSREPGKKEIIKMMHRNARQLLTLINQLLDLSRFDSGKMKLNASYQNIIPFVNGILASFQALALQAKLELEFYSEEKSILLYFDPEKLEHVIGNLLTNAVKFTPANGKITVTIKKSPAAVNEAGQDPGFLEISVCDTGIGIPQEQVAHIFDRFYRVESTQSHDWSDKGTGIGLALSKELVTLHHGKIDVHSIEGKGTELVIRLPLGKAHLASDEIVDFTEVQEVPKAAEERQESSPQSMYSRPFYSTGAPGVTGTEGAAADAEIDDAALNGNQNTCNNKEAGEKTKNLILVVEDNADMRRYIRESLVPHWTVIEAVDGLEGRQKAREIIPDLIISDIMMPHFDGYELCRELKTDIATSHIPIILLTAKASEDNVIRGLETGADDYITKPFNARILTARIKNLMDLRRQLQEKFQRRMVLQPAEIPISTVDERFLEKVQKIIEKNLSDPDFNVEALSKKLDISRVTLNKKLLALTGEYPNELIRSYRLKRAARLLKANFGSITAVTFEVGFSSTAYFTKCFKEKFHQLPSDYHATET